MEQRVAIAGKILDMAAQLGINPEQMVIDPLVLTVGFDNKVGGVSLQTIQALKQQLGVNNNLGVNCAMMDPVKLTSTIRATDLLMGRDNFGSRYISYWRKHKKEETS